MMVRIRISIALLMLSAGSICNGADMIKPTGAAAAVGSKQPGDCQICYANPAQASAQQCPRCIASPICQECADKTKTKCSFCNLLLPDGIISELFAAAQTNQYAAKRQLLDTVEAYPEPLKRQILNRTLLCSAVYSSEPKFDKAIFRDLLRMGVSPNIVFLASSTPEFINCTPLHVAAATGDEELVSILLAYNANPNAVNIDTKATPLWLAVNKKNHAIARRLLEAGATANTVYVAGDKKLSPLCGAVMLDDIAMTRTIIKYSRQPIDVNAYIGATLPIREAVCRGNIPMIRYLLSEGADPEAPAMPGYRWAKPVREVIGSLLPAGKTLSVSDRVTILSLIDQHTKRKDS